MEYCWKDNYRLLTLRYFHRIGNHMAFSDAIHKSIVENWFQTHAIRTYFFDNRLSSAYGITEYG